jgi:hypothetical protein
MLARLKTLFAREAPPAPADPAAEAAALRRVVADQAAANADRTRHSRRLLVAILLKVGPLDLEPELLDAADGEGFTAEVLDDGTVVLALAD